MDMKAFLLLNMVLMSLIFAVNAQSDVYKWIDEQGNVHFTDRPPLNQTTEKIDVKINSYTSVQIVGVDQLLGKTDKVVMYRTSWCRYCEKARDYLSKKKIPYKEYDVENSSKGKRDYEKLGGSGVPIILIGNKRLNGFSAEKFEHLYKERSLK